MAQGAGYSGKALWDKLGLKPGQLVYASSAPANLDALLDGAPETTRLTRLAEFDVALAFVDSRKSLESALAKLPGKLADKGMIWIAWPKKASGIVTDVTEDTVRDVALPLGLVDVKVCAIDATWSGLKLLRRAKGRA